MVTVDIPQLSAGAVAAVGVRVLANVSDGSGHTGRASPGGMLADGTVFGGILLVVNFTAPAANGTMEALASIRTLDPCGIGSGSSGLSTATFAVLPGEATLDVRLLVDHALNVSAVPLSADVLSEVALAAAAGNVSRVVRAVSDVGADWLELPSSHAAPRPSRALL